MSKAKNKKMVNGKKFSSKISSKLFFSFSIIALIPILLIGTVAYYNSSKSLEQEIGVKVQDFAVMNMEQIDQLIYERIKDVETLTLVPTIIEASMEGAEKAKAEGLEYLSVDEAEEAKSDTRKIGNIKAKEFLTKELENTNYFADFAFTDKNGFIVDLTTDGASDFVQNDEQWWNDAFNKGISFKDVKYDEDVRKIYYGNKCCN